MSRFPLLTAGAVMLLSTAAGPAPAQPAVPALTGSSSAAILHLKMTVNSKTSDPGPEVPATGSAPPAYAKKTVRSSYAKSTQILGGLTFDRSATGVQSIASGSATTGAGILTTASAEVHGFTGTLNSPLGKLIKVTTGKVESEARFTQTPAGARSAQGSTSLLNVRIDSDALGIHKTYSGKPKPNEVLYHNGDNSIVIYLNRQIRTTVAGKVASLAVDAVDVQIDNLKFAGQTVSGYIAVAPVVAK